MGVLLFFGPPAVSRGVCTVCVCGCLPAALPVKSGSVSDGLVLDLNSQSPYTH